jgi:hypothetical protein
MQSVLLLRGQGLPDRYGSGDLASDLLAKAEELKEHPSLFGTAQQTGR